jgi:hypothetical protein
VDCCLRLSGNQDTVSEWSDIYGWTVVYGWPVIRIMYQSGVTCMSGLLFTLAGNQDNVSEWSDMYEWTVVYVDRESG